jgi:luciferase family oxidoreductase group 1
MLPNHSPLVVAEQFGTLESLFPGRIDLGLGRAPGTDPITMRALRRERAHGAEAFPDDVRELLAYFRSPAPNQLVRAIPGAGLHVPVWLLGSSLFSAQLAASLGLPFAFAGHFAPALMLEALALYRDGFVPSATLSEPYAMAGVPVVAAASDEEAARLFTSLQLQIVNLHRGEPGPLEPPVGHLDERWNPAEKAVVSQFLREAIVGSPATVKRRLAAFIERTGVDEVMITTQVFDHKARVRSFELVAAIHEELARAEAA